MEAQNFEIIPKEELVNTAKLLKVDGYRFAQCCATNNKERDGFEVLYTFVGEDGMKNIKVYLKDGEPIQSITDTYFNAFVNENEMSDLFGIKVLNNALDFQGNFYKVAIPAPMKLTKEGGAN